MPSRASSRRREIGERAGGPDGQHELSVAQLLALDTDGGADWPRANLLLDHGGTVQPRLDLRAAIENRRRAGRVRVEAPVLLARATPEDDPLAVREEADPFLAARLLDEEVRLSPLSGGS